MGTAAGSLRRDDVDNKYTLPTGLYKSCEWDMRQVRKLILAKQLAPMFPGKESEELGDSVGDHEECPICFLVLFSHASLFALYAIFLFYE